MLKRLLNCLGTHPEVEIITNIDNGEKTIGRKRNELIDAATGEYCSFIDDDDIVTDQYIPLILKAIEKEPDVVCFSGWMTERGRNPIDFHFSINYPYTKATLNGKPVYLRYPNHLTPIKRELLKGIKFENISMFEDFKFANYLHQHKILKTQVIIKEKLYHYMYIPIK